MANEIDWDFFDTNKVVGSVAVAIAGEGGEVLSRHIAPKCSQLFIETWEGERYRVLIEGQPKPRRMKFSAKELRKANKGVK